MLATIAAIVPLNQFLGFLLFCRIDFELNSKFISWLAARTATKHSTWPPLWLHSDCFWLLIPSTVDQTFWSPLESTFQLQNALIFGTTIDHMTSASIPSANYLWVSIICVNGGKEGSDPFFDANSDTLIHFYIIIGQCFATFHSILQSNYSNFFFIHISISFHKYLGLNSNGNDECHKKRDLVSFLYIRWSLGSLISLAFCVGLAFAFHDLWSKFYIFDLILESHPMASNGFQWIAMAYCVRHYINLLSYRYSAFNGRQKPRNISQKIEWIYSNLN